MKPDERIAEWFGGNLHGVRFYKSLVALAHIWDDLVDGDKLVSPDKINKAFFIALVEIPSNPIYASLIGQMLPFWVAIISAYETANAMEAAGEAKGLEISHTLRYAVGHMVAYAMDMTAGHEKALTFMPEMWREVVAENLTDYMKEHLHG